MTMRVTQGMLSNNMLSNLNSNLQRLARYQEQLNTERRINRPSDDPVGFNYSMRYRSELRSNEQFKANRDRATSWLEVTESLMNSVNDIMHRTKELAIQGANGTNPDTSLESIATEIDELLEQLASIGNEKFNGRYVFNGEKTDTQPYEFDSTNNTVTGEVDTGKIVLQIAPGVEMEVNVTGDEVFGDINSGDNLFQILADLSEALRNEDTTGINDVIGRLDKHQDEFLKTMASVGARTRRIALTTERLEDDNYNLQKLLSRTEDVDVAEAITNLKMAENVYIASLSVGSRIIQPSLVDFLR